MQEVVSVVASLLNGLPWAVVLAVPSQRARFAPAAAWTSPWALLLAATSALAWLMSMFFHARETVYTERLDYFCAGLSVTCMLLVGVVRTNQLRRPSQWAPWATALGILLLTEVAYMALVRFHHTLHIAIAVGGVVSSVFPWAFWAWRHRRQARTDLHVVTPVLLMCWLLCVGILEVVDFPPLLQLLDAHALWHLGTAPLSCGWVWWWIADGPRVAAEAGQGAPDAERERRKQIYRDWRDGRREDLPCSAADAAGGGGGGGGGGGSQLRRRHASSGSSDAGHDSGNSSDGSEEMPFLARASEGEDPGEWSDIADEVEREEARDAPARVPTASLLGLDDEGGQVLAADLQR